MIMNIDDDDNNTQEFKYRSRSVKGPFLGFVYAVDKSFVLC